MLRRNVKHYEIQTIATAMDAYASLDSDITGATLYFLKTSHLHREISLCNISSKVILRT